MQKWVILAESGGTKTDWSVIESGQEVQRLTTMSFHPHILTRLDVIEVAKLIPALMNPHATLLIYSAGCFHEQGKIQLRDLLRPFACQVEIKSDLEAAVEATDQKEGWVAIMGTGSALIHFEGKSLNLFGGLGWDKGDEGSGFYFGKLVVEDMRKGINFQEIDARQKDELLNQYGRSISKSSYSKLSKQLPFTEFKSHHIENVRLFIERYVLPNNVIKLTVIGGYAFAIQEVMIRIFKSYDIDIELIICSPLTRIKGKFLAI